MTHTVVILQYHSQYDPCGVLDGLDPAGGVRRSDVTVYDHGACSEAMASIMAQW